MNNKSYLFEFDYGTRMDQKLFLLDLMKTFDNQSLTGITFFVNNNPYHLEFLLLLVFEKEDKLFDQWIGQQYPEKKHRFVYNYHLNDLIDKQLNSRRYSAFSFSTPEQMNKILTPGGNEIFFYPTREIVSNIWGGEGQEIDSYTVFLSHSSKDKPFVNNIFLELQKSETKVWYDQIEIDFGDSITEKINDGLNRSHIGLICISRNFLSANWAKSELNYFMQKRINSGLNNLICLNLDLEHKDLPPLIQDYRYIRINEEGWIDKLISAINKRKGARQPQ